MQIFSGNICLLYLVQLVIYVPYPRRHPRSHRNDQLAKVLQEILPAPLIPKDRSPVDSSDHHVVKRPRSIKSRKPWHNNLLSQSPIKSKVVVLINVPKNKLIWTAVYKHIRVAT
jgi:hypothetical protein